MHNILIILKRPPYPLYSGGDQAMFNGIFAIKEKTKVFLTYLDNGGKLDNRRIAFEKVVPEVKVIPYVTYTHYSLSQKIKKAIKKIYLSCIKRDYRTIDDELFYPLYSCERYPMNFMNHINQIIGEYNIDIVQIEMIWYASLVTCLPPQVKKIFVHHELAFVRHQLEMEKYGANIERIAALKINKMIEIGLLNMFDAIITLSSTDSKKLHDNGVNVPIYTSFAVVQSNIETSEILTDIHKLVFVGPQSSPPNVIGLEFFLEKCWGNLLKVDRDYKLDIIGNWNKNKIAEITNKYKSIHFKGFVPNLKDAISDAIMIVPITVGSGIRMKIIEAGQIGIPIVTTSIGVEGIPFKNEKECLIADSPEEFVEAILHMKNHELRNKMTTAAKDIIEKNYSMQALINNRIDIYTKICNG